MIRFVDAAEVWATVSPTTAVDAIERAICAQAEGAITPSASLGISLAVGAALTTTNAG